ncbi:MAG: hypothetical protein VB934_14210 [Polyangiaceae bacterium]
MKPLLSVAVLLLSVPVRMAQPSDPFHAQPVDSPAGSIRLKETAAGAQLGIDFKWLGSDRRSDYAAGLVLSVPLGRTVESADLVSSGLVAQGPRAASAKLEPLPASAAQSKGPPAMTFTPAELKAAVRAGLQRSGFGPSTTRLDALSARSRRAAWLPRLQLRTTRLLDETTTLSPTSYDPERTTHSGGARTWLEARMSWDLDRLLFGGHELQAERMRQQLLLARRRKADELVTLIGRWQRVVFVSRDPASPWPRCRHAWLEERQLAMKIDWLTAGWLNRWRKRHAPAPLRPCIRLPSDADMFE